VARAKDSRGKIVDFATGEIMNSQAQQSASVKKSVRRQQRELEILNAAREVFLEKGFERAAVSEIAARVGVVEGLIFRYFPTKRELLNEVLLTLYDPLIRDVGEGFARITGLSGRLRFIVWRHLRFYTENSGFARLILHEVRTSPDYSASVLHGLNVRYTDFLRLTLQQAITEGEVAETVDCVLLRAIVYGGIEHLMWPVLYGERKVDVERLADTYTDQILTGLPRHSKTALGIEDRLARLEQLLVETATDKKGRKT